MRLKKQLFMKYKYVYGQDISMNKSPISIFFPLFKKRQLSLNLLSCPFLFISEYHKMALEFLIDQTQMKY